MQDLVLHLVRPLVNHPDDVSVAMEEGESVVQLTLSVNDADRATVRGDDGRTLRAIRTVVSAAAGSRKASLDLARADGDDDGDDSSDDAGADGDAS